jgi:hypothetical protein
MLLKGDWLIWMERVVGEEEEERVVWMILRDGMGGRDRVASRSEWLELEDAEKEEEGE